MFILPQHRVLTRKSSVHRLAGETGKEKRMGLKGEHAVLDETANWSAELHFQKINKHGMGRSLSPSREVSPVPSYYSEPVSVPQHKYVTGRLPALVRGSHQEEEDDEDTQSFKSLPTVMNTSAPDSKVKRSHRLTKGKVDFSLPLLVTSKCTLVVKGTGCTRTRGFLPAIKSKGPQEHKSLERPPGRAGCRPGNTETGAPQHVQNPAPSQSHLSEKTWNTREGLFCSAPKLALGPRILFQNPMVQPVYPLTADMMKVSRQTAQDWQPLRPGMKNTPVLNRGALHCLFEENYFPCPRDPYLLEPISGFQEHLCHQLLNSPLPQVNSHHILHLGAMLPVQQGSHGSTQVGRTIELCNSQGKRLPSITMTCPTPSPKHLHHSENRHVA